LPAVIQLLVRKHSRDTRAAQRAIALKSFAAVAFVARENVFRYVLLSSFFIPAPNPSSPLTLAECVFDRAADAKNGRSRRNPPRRYPTSPGRSDRTSFVGKPAKNPEGKIGKVPGRAPAGENVSPPLLSRFPLAFSGLTRETARDTTVNPMRADERADPTLSRSDFKVS